VWNQELEATQLAGIRLASMLGPFCSTTVRSNSTQVRWCSVRSVGAEQAVAVGRMRQATQGALLRRAQWRYTVPGPICPLGGSQQASRESS